MENKNKLNTNDTNKVSGGQYGGTSWDEPFGNCETCGRAVTYAEGGDYFEGKVYCKEHLEEAKKKAKQLEDMMDIGV